MSQDKGKINEFNYSCSYCGQKINPTEIQLRLHVKKHIEGLDIMTIIKDFYNQYCKTCDKRQNQEYL